MGLTRVGVLGMECKGVMAVLGGVVVLVMALISGALYSKVNNESPIDAVALTFSAPAAKLEGVYAPNSLLQGVVKLGEGKLSKPEDMVAHPSGQFLYVATADGWIKKLYLKDGAVEDWKFVGGRPLGLALGPDGELIVANTHIGLLKVTPPPLCLLVNSSPHWAPKLMMVFPTLTILS